MAAAAVDVGFISTYLSVPQTTISTAIESPTTDLVISILEAITAKAKLFEEYEADNIRLNIELENAVRSSETRIDGLKATIEKSQKTAEEVRTQLKEEGEQISSRIHRSYSLMRIRECQIILGNRTANIKILLINLDVRS